MLLRKVPGKGEVGECLVKKGKKPTKRDLVGLLNKNWVAEGYTSKAHQEKRKKQGERMLKDFFDQAYDPKKIPRDLEQSFTVRVSPMLKVGGRIDRVDKVGNRLEVIDYKTGKVMDQKEIDSSLQMTIYALAAADEGIYGVKPEEVALSFYFLDEGKKRSTTRTAKELKEAKGQWGMIGEN